MLLPQADQEEEADPKVSNQAVEAELLIKDSLVAVAAVQTVELPAVVEQEDPALVLWRTLVVLPELGFLPVSMEPLQQEV